MQMRADEYFESIYGEFGLSPNDAARWVFASGWNCAMQEIGRRFETMPDVELRAAFHKYLQSMMQVDMAAMPIRRQ
jgi:hypothetical protein